MNLWIHGMIMLDLTIMYSIVITAVTKKRNSFMKLQEALDIIEAAQVNGLRESSQIEKLQSAIANDSTLRDKICQAMHYSPEGLDAFLKSKQGLLRNSDAEPCPRRPPRRFRIKLRP